MQIGRDSWWEWNRHDHQAVVRIGKRGVYWRWQLWSQLPSGPRRQSEGKDDSQKKFIFVKVKYQNIQAVLLGAVFLIDFMFFEKSNNNENDGIGMIS